MERAKDINKACHLIHVSRSSLTYKSIKNDKDVIDKLNNLAELFPREGFWKCYNRLRNKGEIINHKRLHRVYQLLGLPLRRKGKKRLPERVKQPLMVPESFTNSWSIDFMSDALIGGRKFRSFNVIDDYNREVLFIEIDYSIKSSRVLWVLRHLVARYKKPKQIRMDNGPEFIAKLAQEWSQMMGIDFQYIQPGKPMQNAYIERFNKSYRQGVLDCYLFDSLDEVREITEKWVEDYNHFRPHDSLGGISPVMYRTKENNKNLGGLRSASATPSLHSAPLNSLTKLIIN